MRINLGSGGKSQYAVLENDKWDVHIQLIQQDYSKDKICRDFETSGLNNMARVYSKAIKKN